MFCGWIFESYGFTYKDIQSWGGKLYSNNFDDIVNMTKDGQLDAIVWVGPGESWFFTEIAQNVDLVWLPVDEKIMDDVAKKHGLGKGTIPGSLFKGMVGKNIPTVTECNELTVRADLDEDTVYKLTKAFIENLDDIRKGCATWADWHARKVRQGHRRTHASRRRPLLQGSRAAEVAPVSPQRGEFPPPRVPESSKGSLHL